MSLICPRAKCTEEKGPCTCEKVTAVIIVLVVFLFFYLRIIEQP
jgi:hypothetical protein